MKMKKILSSLMCFAISFTLMGVVFYNHANNVKGLELASAEFNLSEMDFTEDSLLFDPELVSGGGSNFGGNIKVAPVETANTDALAIRVKNLTNDEFRINTLYIQCDNNFSYSFMASNITYLDVNGNVSSYKAVTGGRGTNIPASFDGVMIIPWNELVSIKSGTPSYVWTRRAESDKLQKDSSDPAFMYPTETISYFSFYFFYEEKNAGVNELLVGSVYTLTEVEGEYEITTFDNPFTLEGSPDTVITNGVKVTDYPSTTATYTFEVNGVEATFDETINLNASFSSSRYGYSPKVNYTLAKGYTLSYVELDGNVVNLNEVVNLDKEDSTHVLNFVTIKEYIYQISEDDTLDLTDKKGIIVDVNNTLDESINYSLVVKDLDDKDYVASSKGAGIFINEDDLAYYGNVFEIPLNFKGKVFIPFNVSAAGYGTVNNLPWSENLPNIVDSTIRLNFIKSDTLTAEALETVFDNWDFVSEIPSITLASSANLATGDVDFNNGIAIGLETTYLNNWSNTAAIRINPKEEIDFNVLGLALRVRNIGANDFSSRIYLTASNNATYVPSTEMNYTLVHSDGTVEEKVSNRTVVIPSLFDGTLILHTHSYATDNLNVVGSANSNVIKDGLKLKTISLFLNAHSSDDLLLSPTLAILDLNNEVQKTDVVYDEESIYHHSVTVEGVKYDPRATSVILSDLVVKVNDEDNDGSKVEVNHESLLVGNTLVVSPLDGYQIVSATLNGESLTLNEDGTYSINITQNYEEGATLEIEVVAKYRVNVGFDNELGNVKINDEDINENAYYDEGEEITLTVNAINGYKIKEVKVNGEVVSGEDGVYTLTVNSTTNVEVEFETITYTITYELDGGVNNEHNPTTYTINDSFVLGNPTKEGYEFKGWYVLDENNEKVDILRVDEGSTGDLTIYASFEELEDDPVDPTTPEDSNPWPIILGVSGGVIVLAIGVYLFLKKKK